MSALLPSVDPDGLLEYSVVFSDRSLNHMSVKFQHIMRDISSTLKQVYQAEAVALVPGGGTYGMEAVARQFATAQKCLIIRNGWFSYRWTQIFEMGAIPAEQLVIRARPINSEKHSPFAPPPLQEVVAAIKAKQPTLVFAPHVETASGIILPDDYIREVADAVHSVGGLLVLDCVASGTLWVNMRDCGVDVLISAPQKGWSASPCSAFVMFSAAANARLEQTRSTSFACDLLKWRQIMQAYENGAHAYHATMPTDSIARFWSTMKEIEAYGFEKVKIQQQELGAKIRAMLAKKGFSSVAALGFEAPSVVVSFTDDNELHKGTKFIKQGIQIAPGVPLMCDEAADYKSFRVGLFGLEKLQNIERTVENLAKGF